MRIRSVVVALLVLAAAGIVAGLARPRSAGSPTSRPVSRVGRAPVAPVRQIRAPQFVVVSFDGSGGSDMFEYWRTVARRVHARFTFFVSGVYLIDWAHNSRYHPPRHRRGRSDIGFAPDAQFADATLAQAGAAYEEGHEIGTHFNGHFCAPLEGNVDEWSADDWADELDQFDALMFSGHTLPFGSNEIVGTRTPCLEGRPRVLYPVLARRGFRYDASQVALLGTWPWRERGIWSVPLLELPFVGHTFRVVSMDYNFLANQTDTSENVERETYLTFRRAFRTSYRGNRAPLSIGFHFETWHGGAYDRALTQFLGETCRLRDVRCVSIRELVDWLDLRFPRLALYPH
jgi:hypothetical protein